MLGDVWGVGVRSRTSPEHAGEVPCKWDCQGIYKEFASKLCPNLPPQSKLNGCPISPKGFKGPQLRLNGFPNLSRKAPKDPQNEPKPFPNGGQWKGPGRPWAPSGKLSRCLGRLWGRFGTLGGRLCGPDGTNWSPRGRPADPTRSLKRPT